MDTNIAVKVDHATVRFNMASERIDNLKEYFVKLVQGKLMFQEFLALKDVSFEVKKGESWGLIGTNGSGKSTMLKLIDFAELRDFLDMPIKNYSSGMSARLGFAVATVVRPDILICDEVLAVGDYAFQQKCEKRMTDMREAGTTLLYVSHNMASVKNVCDKALWLNKGVVKDIGPVDEIAEKYMKFEKE